MVALSFAVTVSAILFGAVVPEAHADDSEAPKAESPYFHVKGADTDVDALPLKATRVDVRIAGVIADVTVTQHYRNEGQRPSRRAMCSPAPRRPPCTR